MMKHLELKGLDLDLFWKNCRVQSLPSQKYRQETISRKMLRQRTPKSSGPSMPLSCKVCFVGTNGVGKTTIVNRLTQGKFYKYSEFTESTVGSTFVSNCTPDNKTKLDIWDTAGQERYGSLCALYYRNAPIVVIVLCVGGEATGEQEIEEDSFTRMKKMVRDILRTSGDLRHFLVAINKVDLDPSGDRTSELYARIQEFMKDKKSKHRGPPFDYSTVTISAKTETNFQTFRQELYQQATKYAPRFIRREGSRVPLSTQAPPKRKRNSCPTSCVIM